MGSTLSFAGELRPLPYAVRALAAFVSQHVVTLTALWMRGARPSLDGWFYVSPLRTLAMQGSGHDPALLLAFAFLLLVAWALAALSFQRAANANVSEWIAAAAIAPVVQIPVILFLCAAPPRNASQPAPQVQLHEPVSGWPEAVQGFVVALALMLFAVAVSALGFRVYGYGLFVASPFVIGAATAYFVNRRSDIGVGRTLQLVAGATALGGLGLLATALEGLLCLVLAFPIGLGAALVGAMLGRGIALLARRPPGQATSGFALLPLIFAVESALPAATSFETRQSIEVAAPADAVWRAILHMEPMQGPLALPFRLGVAHPLSGEVLGEGVGALRRGEFSTGTAVERVVEWAPGEKLAFVVIEDVPALREMSPYRHVRAPHAVGYFRTGRTSFELVPRAGGRTEVIEQTSHDLRLDPVLYWLPMTKWIVQENNARVLANIKRQAERTAVAAAH